MRQQRWQSKPKKNLHNVLFLTKKILIKTHDFTKMLNSLSKNNDFIKMINSLSKTNDFIKMINSLSKTDDSIK